MTSSSSRRVTALCVSVVAAGLLAAPALAEDAIGNWFGAIDGHNLTYVHIETGADGLTGYIDLHELPADPDNHNDHRALENLSATPGHLTFHFTTSKSSATFDGTWDATKKAWVGKAAWRGGHKATLTLWRTTAPTLATAKMPAQKEVDDPVALDRIVKAYVANKTFMGTVLVARGDRILLDKAYGYANLELKVPNTPHTRFMIASVSKQFAAASILLLEEQGKVKVSDPVSKYITDAPDAWKVITLRNLLTHTSGIPEVNASERAQTAIGAPVTPDQIIADAEKRPLDFPTDSKYAYSNTNYTLLARIVEKVSGEAYPDFLDHHIFQPLGMKETTLANTPDIVPNRADGYVFGSSGLANREYWDAGWLFGAGSVISTTHDLLLWERALMGGKVLRPETLRRMTTPYKEHYAYGLGYGAVNGYGVIEHNGRIPGFNSELAYYPDDKLTVILLSNLDSWVFGPMSSRLAAASHGEKVDLPPVRTFAKVSSDVLKSYVGTYQILDNQGIGLKMEGDTLVFVASDFRHALSAQSDTKFFLANPPVDIAFAKDANGQPVMTYERDGRKITSPRIVHTEVPVSADVLAGYVGTYALPDDGIVITLENGQLFQQGTEPGAVKEPIFPESETRFFFKVIEAQIEFVKGADGKVTSLILHQDGKDTPGVRK